MTISELNKYMKKYPHVESMVKRKPICACAIMDRVEQFKGSYAINRSQQSVSRSQDKDRWKPMGFEEKKAAVNEEIGRMNQLPGNSSFATHRLRVLNKIMQLLSIQRTTSQDEELELLFAGLSL